MGLAWAVPLHPEWDCNKKNKKKKGASTRHVYLRSWRAPAGGGQRGAHRFFPSNIDKFHRVWWHQSHYTTPLSFFLSLASKNNSPVRPRSHFPRAACILRAHNRLGDSPLPSFPFDFCFSVRFFQGPKGLTTETMSAVASDTDCTDDHAAKVVSIVRSPTVPAELLWHIQAQLDSPRDHAACVMASRLFYAALLRRSIRGLDAYRLLRARAPLDTIKGALADPTPNEAERLVGSAAHLGRLDVVAWAYGRVPVAWGFYMCDTDRIPQQRLVADGHWSGERWQSAKIFHREPRERYAGVAVNAMHEAAYCGNVAVLRWLLSLHFPLASATVDPLERELFAALVADAAGGIATSTDIMAYLHHYGSLRFPPVHDMYRGKVCACPMRTWEAAVNADRGDVLAWLDAASCSGRFNQGLVPWESPMDEIRGRHPLVLAIQEGHGNASKWLSHALGVSAWPSRDPLLAKALVTAASRGHVDVLRIFHGLGAQRCPPLALLEAAGAGRADVLKWAMGDGLLQEPAVPRILGWPSPSVGCAAAASGRDRTVRWLIARPDARINLGVGAHVYAVKRGHMETARALVDAQIIPLDQWDALYAAVKSRSRDMIRYMAERGAACSARVLARVIGQGEPTTMALLCGLYGTADVQAALDSRAGYGCQPGVVAWIRDNVRDACVAQAGPHCQIVCRCARCQALESS
nr:ankyrin repeat [Pandoravirus massiliensis]